MADLLADAQERYREAIDATSEQRRQIEEDLRFSDPTNPQQWDEQEKKQRESDPGGRRPCLVHDQITQYVQNVVGQVEQSPPALHALPVDGGDRRVAEQLDGFYRHIEHSSRAHQHYTRVAYGAARPGVGYLIILPEYVDRALNWQEPRITSEGDPLSVVIDPWSVELDGSDATFGHWLTSYSHKSFEREWGEKRAKVNFGDAEGRVLSDERESVLVATEWRVETKETNCIVYLTAEGDEASLPEDQFWQAKQADPNLQPIRTYSDKKRSVRWARMSGADVLTEDREYPADHIGIVPVYGYATWENKRLKFCGMPRRAMTAQRSYNYHLSEMRAYMAQAPKSPWVGDARAFAGFESLWDRASVDNRAFLPFNGVDDAGQPIDPPMRAPLAINLANHQQGALQAREDIQAALGMYAANIGKQSNAQSGVAYEAQKEQGEASTSLFPANMKASLGHAGRIIMQMIPRLMDTRRQLRTLSVDMTPGRVQLDPKQSKPLVETEQGLSINPNVGRYDVRVVVGPSFATQRSQTQEALSEVMTRNPELTPAIAPLWAQTLDMPNGDKLAQVLTAMAPEAVQAILNPDQQESTAALKGQIQQLQQALQEAIQHAHEAQQEADEATSKLNDKSMEAETRDEETAIKAYDAQTKRLQVLAALIPPEPTEQLAQETAETAQEQPVPTAEPPEEVVEAQVPEPQIDIGAEIESRLAPILASNQQLASLVSELMKVVQKPRERVPVRDAAGNITRVIEMVADSATNAEGMQ